MHNNKCEYLPNGYFDQLETVDNVPFTAREIDIIACIIHMRGSSKIAFILNIAPRTVETHIANIKRKIENSAREGIIDFVEKSGKFAVFRKHYQNLLIQADFNKRLKSISILVRNKTPVCNFFEAFEKEEKSIISEIQNHLQTAGIKIIYLKPEEIFAESSSLKHSIYVVSDLLINQLHDNSSKIVEQISVSSANYTFLVLDSSKINISSKLKELSYLDLEQGHYYLIVFEILKRILAGTNLDNIILGFKMPDDLINSEIIDQSALPLAKSSIEVENNFVTHVVARLFRNKIWLIGTSVAVIGAVIFGYNVHFKEDKERNVEVANLSPIALKPLIGSYMPEVLTGYEKFIGRERELKQITQALTAGDIVVITGRSGVGKSSLAIEYGKRHKQDKIIRYFNADAATKIDQTYREIAIELGIHIEQLSRNLVMQLVNNKLSSLSAEMLFIFDNVDEYDDVKEYLSNLPPNVKIIITTKKPKLIADKIHITLEEFNNDESKQYLQNGLQNRNLDQESTQKLIENIGALPYDLKCIIAYLLDNPSVNSKALAKETGSKIKEKLFEELAISQDKTKQQAWKILQYGAYLDSDFISIEIFKSLFPQNEQSLSDGLKKLESLSLISIITDKSGELGFRIHRKLQKSVQHSMKNHPEYAISEQELYSGLLITLDKLFEQLSSDPDTKWQKASRLQPHIEKLLHVSTKNLSKEDKISQASLYFKLSKYYSEVNINFKQALKYAKISLIKRQNLYFNQCAEIADSLSRVGQAYQDLGAIKKGLEYFEKAFAIRKTLYSFDDPIFIDSLNNIGITYYKLGDIKKSLEYFNQALKVIYTLHLNNDPHILKTLHNIGSAYEDLGDTEKGLEYFKRALEAVDKLHLSNHPYVARALSDIGCAYQNLGDIKKGIRYNEMALKMMSSLYSGNHPNVAKLLQEVANSYHKLGNYTKAIEYSNKSIAMYNSLYPEGNRRTTYSLHILGACLIQIDNIETGLNVLHKTLDISENFNMDGHYVTACIFYDLGRGYLKNRDYKKALEYSEKALRLRQELYAVVKNHQEIAESLNSVGNSYRALGNKARALELYKQALAMFTELSLGEQDEAQTIRKKIVELEK